MNLLNIWVSYIPFGAPCKPLPHVYSHAASLKPASADGRENGHSHKRTSINFLLEIYLASCLCANILSFSYYEETIPAPC